MPSHFTLCTTVVIFAVQNESSCSCTDNCECSTPCSGIDSEILQVIRNSLSVTTEQISDSSSGGEFSGEKKAKRFD